MVAASLCMKPTLTPSEAAKVGALKEASPGFVVMQRVAMRFRGLLQGGNPSKLDRFLHDAGRSRLPLMRQFARTLMRDVEAVRHAIAEPWSSGQAEGQINRLKTLKRAMYGRADIELLRAQMLPLEPSEHEMTQTPLRRPESFFAAQCDENIGLGQSATIRARPVELCI
jgi:hypothetical protein